MPAETPAARRFERWLELLPWVRREPEGAALSELARRFEDTEAGIVADLEALVAREYYLTADFAEGARLLIEPDRVAVEGPGPFERPIRLTPLEALALQLGLQVVLAETPDEDRAPLKEAARHLTQARSSFEADGADVEGAPTGDPIQYGPPLPAVDAGTYRELSRALRERRAVEIRYFKPHEPDEAPWRRVEPWALAAVREVWYLLGRDTGPGEPRVFRLDRVLAARATGEPAEVPADLRIEEYLDPEGVYRGDEDDLDVTICYSKRIARWARERYGSDAEAEPDGSVAVRLRCKSPWWAVARVLGYGTDARVTGPDRVRILAVEALRLVRG